MGNTNGEICWKVGDFGCNWGEFTREGIFGSALVHSNNSRTDKLFYAGIRIQKFRVYSGNTYDNSFFYTELEAYLWTMRVVENLNTFKSERILTFDTYFYITAFEGGKGIDELRNQDGRLYIKRGKD